MKDIDAIRRENLRLIEKEVGSPTEAAKLFEMTPSQFTNLRDGAKDSKTGKPRGMRKETARRIEVGAGKPPGWLDIDHVAPGGFYAEFDPAGNLDSDLARAIQEAEDNPALRNEWWYQIHAYYRTAEHPIHEEASNATPPQGNVSTGPDIRGLVPLISSVQAGEWCEIVDRFQPGDAEDWLPCPVKHGPSTFCLRVDGQSMSNPGSKPSYEEGDIIFVDPDRAAQPGDRVVARLESQTKATFKQYLEEDGRKFLKALNPEWKPRFIEINGEATICGVVIGKWVPE